MDLKKIIHSFDNCPCGRKHAFDLQTYKAEKEQFWKKSSLPEAYGHIKEYRNIWMTIP